MAVEKTSTTTSKFKKSDGFINLNMVLVTKDGTEVPIKAPVWGLDMSNPLHKKILENPEGAAKALKIKDVTINLAKTDEDMKDVSFG